GRLLGVFLLPALLLCASRLLDGRIRKKAKTDKSQAKNSIVRCGIVDGEEAPKLHNLWTNFRARVCRTRCPLKKKPKCISSHERTAAFHASSLWLSSGDILRKFFPRKHFR